MNTAQAMAPVTLLPNSFWTEHENGDHYRHFCRANAADGSVHQVVDFRYGELSTRKARLSVLVDDDGVKSYRMEITRMFGYYPDRVGYTLVAVGDTPRKVRENFDALRDELNRFSIADVCRMALDFEKMDWPLDADFSTSEETARVAGKDVKLPVYSLISPKVAEL